MESSPESRARRLVDSARDLTEEQVRDLSREVTALAGWLGTKRRWLRAWEHATNAADSAGFGGQMEILSNDSLLAVLEASAYAATAKGRDIDRLTAELQTFRSAPQQDVAVKRLHGVARKSLGIRASHRIGPSSLGVGGAALALLTSELVEAHDIDGAEEHDVLLRPWRNAIGPEPT